MLSDKALDILNSPSLTHERDGWFARLQALYDGNAERKPFRLAGHVAGASDGLQYTDPEQWVADNLEALADTVAQSEPQDAYFKPWCVECAFYGVHFLDKIFGAEVFFEAGMWNANYLRNAVGSLAVPDLETDETWALAKRAARAFVVSGVKLPLFGTPTLSSALNIAVNLYGQEILAVMLENPGAAAHDLRVVNDVIRHMHEWYVANVPETQLQPVISWWRTQPPGYGQICGCTTQLLSGELYAEFIAPLDNEILGVHPRGGMLHMCGAHAQHIPALRAMTNLRAIQINDRAAHDLPLFFAGLRDDQIIYLDPCDGMTAARALAITGGDRLVVTGV